MHFLYPERLWYLFLVIVPIIIHLFHFRRQKTLFFSSLKFIKFIEQENKSTRKLKHLLVLFSRICLFIFAILAFAQPTFEKEDGKVQSGTEVLAIYIDNSFSMSAKGTEGELLSEARETTKRIIEKSADNISFFICSNTLDGSEQRLLSKAEALDYVEKLDYSPIVRSLQDIITWQKNYLTKENNEQKKIGKVTNVFLSDFQTTSATIDKKIETENMFHIIKFSPQSSSNITIDSIWFANPIHKPGFQNELFIRLKNFTDEKFLNTEVTLNLNGSLRSSFIDVPQNKDFTTSFKLTETSNGTKIGKISVNDKQQFWDDDFYFSYEVSSTSNILILDYENASLATGKVFEVEPYFSTQIIPENSFNKSKLTNKDLLVLNGVNEPTSGLINDVKEFIDNGGSIVIIPGKEVDFAAFNSLLSILDLPQLASKSSNTSRIKTVEFKDVFFAGVFEKESPNLNMPNISNYYTIQSIQNGKSLLTLQNNIPLLLKNNKKSYLFTTAIQEDFSNLASNAIFPTVLLRMGELSNRTLPLYATIGIDNSILMPIKNDSEKPARLLGANGDFIPSQQKRTGQIVFSINGAEAIEKLKSGNYQIVGDEKYGTLSINYNRNESNAACKNKEEIIALFKDAGIKNITFSEVKNGEKATALELEKTSELWRIFLLISLLFILIEMALLKFLK